jgi:hypothetical protein
VIAAGEAGKEDDMRTARMLLVASCSLAGMLLDPKAGESQGATDDQAEGTLTLTRDQFQAEVRKAAAAQVQDELKKAKEAEASERIKEIRFIAATLAPHDKELKAKAEAAVADANVTVEAFRAAARDHMIEAHKPVGVLGFSVGIEEQDKLNDAVALAVIGHGDPSIRQAIESGGDGGARVARAVGFDTPAQFASAMRTLDASGLRSRKLSQLLGYCVNASDRARYFQSGSDEQFRMLANHGTSNFQALLENIANKEVAGAAALQQVTYTQWCRIGSARDFRDQSVVTLSNFEQLKEVREFGIPDNIFMKDRGVKSRAVKYMANIGLTIEALRNDDVGALVEMPRLAAMMGELAPEAMACRMINEAQSTSFTPDGVSVVASARGNLNASGGASALTPAAAEATYQKMLEVSDFGEGAAPIAVTPRFLLVPPSRWGAADRLFRSDNDWSNTVSQGDKPINTMKGRLTPIVSAYFGAKFGSSGSDTRWTVIADPVLMPVIQINFLDGRRTPTYSPKNFGTNTIIGGELMMAFGATFVHPEAVSQNDGQ